MGVQRTHARSKAERQCSGKPLRSSWCRSNRKGEVEVIPAEQINEAYERVVNSDVRYRFVIDATTF